jgi:hypothetical protein
LRGAKDGGGKKLCNREKPSSPQYYWFNALSELVATLSPTDPRNTQFYNLLFGALDAYMLSVPSFCQHEPPQPVQLTLDDFLSSAWIDKFKQMALAFVYYNLCQEDDDVMKQTTVSLASAQIANLATTPVELLPSPGVGVTPQIVNVVARYTFGSVAFTTVGDLLVYRDTVSNVDATIPGDLLTNANTGYSQVSANAIDGTAVDLTNKAIYLSSNGTADTSGGDGSLTIDIFYVLIGP